MNHIVAGVAGVGLPVIKNTRVVPCCKCSIDTWVSPSTLVRATEGGEEFDVTCVFCF